MKWNQMISYRHVSSIPSHIPSFSSTVIIAFQFYTPKSIKASFLSFSSFFPFTSFPIQWIFYCDVVKEIECVNQEQANVLVMINCCIIINDRSAQKLTNYVQTLLTAIVSEKFFSLSPLLRTPPMLKNVGFSPLLGFCSSTQLLNVNKINVHK